MRRKRNTAGIPYSSRGHFGAFSVLVAAIVIVVLAFAYSDNNSDDSGGAARGTPAATQGNGAQVNGASANRARAARARAATLARVAVRRAAARRAAARRAVARAGRTRVVVVGERTFPVLGGGGQNVCAPLGPRGGGRAQRQARRQRVLQRRQALYNLNLRC
jgi:hypothetical protein